MNDEINILGKMDHTLDHTFESANRVYGTDGVCPTIPTCCGGGHQPKIMDIVAMRGRGDDNTQQLEVRDEDICNTLTTVQKDNMVLETVQIRQATKNGLIECEVGGVADLSYPTNNTRRGRVIEGVNISPTITTENVPSRIEPWVWNIDGEDYKIRIRKLTPKECGRLMGVADEDIDKMAAVNSQTQQYKEFGNSIVVDVMAHMFKNLFPESYEEIIKGDNSEMEKRELIHKEAIKMLTMEDVLKFIQNRLKSEDKESDEYKIMLNTFNTFKELMYKIDSQMEA